MSSNVLENNRLRVGVFSVAAILLAMWNGLHRGNMPITFHKAYLMPIIVFVWFQATFLITYTIAVMLKSVPPVWPYISDTGTFSPESCIFGQLLNTGSILMAVVTYLRYRHVGEVIMTEADEKTKKLNLYAFWSGLVASFGVGVVGNFQETNLFACHAIAAAMAFGCGTVYQILQAIISWKIYPLMGTKSINILRVCLAGICGICSNLTFVFAVSSMTKFDGTDITKWTSEYKGYKEHLFSSVNEWITATCTMAFILTFADELRYIKVVEPEILIEKKPSEITEVEKF